MREEESVATTGAVVVGAVVATEDGAHSVPAGVVPAGVVKAGTGGGAATWAPGGGAKHARRRGRGRVACVDVDERALVGVLRSFRDDRSGRQRRGGGGDDREGRLCDAPPQHALRADVAARAGRRV